MECTVPFLIQIDLLLLFSLNIRIQVCGWWYQIQYLLLILQLIIWLCWGISPIAWIPVQMKEILIKAELGLRQLLQNSTACRIHSRKHLSQKALPRLYITLHQRYCFPRVIHRPGISPIHHPPSIFINIICSLSSYLHVSLGMSRLAPPDLVI